MRCYRYNQIGNWAKECRYSWRHKQSPSHLILTAQLDTLEKIPHQAHHSSTESSEVFASDVTEFEDLAEVLRNNDLFEVKHIPIYRFW